VASIACLTHPEQAAGTGQTETDAQKITNGRVPREPTFVIHALRRLDFAVCGRLSFGKGFLEALHCWSVRPCVRPVGAVRKTAGHNAFREDGSRP
jgi:hypothetical protein